MVGPATGKARPPTVDSFTDGYQQTVIGHRCKDGGELSDGSALFFLSRTIAFGEKKL